MKSLILFILILTIACDQAKVIEASDSTEEGTGIFSDEPLSKTLLNSSPSSTSSFESEIHQVEIKEVLPTSKYVYVYAKENGKVFWMACRKQEVKLGETYFYRGALMKTNFESKEYNRTFDTLYLVSNLIPADADLIKQTFSNNNNTSPSIAKNIGSSKFQKIAVEGSIKIADIIANPKSFEGKTIQISGICVKMNAQIMGRNWIHLKDGSKDDYDFVLTSDVTVPVGQLFTMTAVVSLNKDFGAGYKYDIILEDGELITMQ